MRYALSCLLRNLGAGLRLVLMLPVARLAFRVDLAQLLLLFVLSALIDVAGDWLRAEAPRIFWIQGAGAEFYSVALLLLGAAVIALLNRQKSLAMAVPVIVFAAMPLVQVVHNALIILAGHVDRLELIFLLEQLAVLWIVVVLIRSVYVACAHLPVYSGLRAIGGGLLLAAPIWFSGVIFPNEPWWRSEGSDLGDGSTLNAGSEAVLAAQAHLLVEALDELKDERPGQSDLYFVGFAPYGRDVSYTEDVEAAQHAMDTKWGTLGRSLVLANSPESLLTVPYASVTNLREVLNEIGSIIERDDDVVMVFMTGRGGPGSRLVAELPPLSLVGIAPAGLKQLLDDAGILWRIVVVAACQSGGYLKPLEDEHTLIITSDAPDGDGQDCTDSRQSGQFSAAMFPNGLGRGMSLDDAFGTAQAQSAAGAGQPQRFVGSAMSGKLRTLRNGGTSGTMVSAPRRQIRS